MQLAVNLQACARAAQNVQRIDDAERARSADQSRRERREAMKEQRQQAMRDSIARKQAEEFRQQRIAMGMPVLPSTSVAAPDPVEIERKPTVPVTLDLRPPDMRRGGSVESLDPSQLNVMVDGAIIGSTRAGEVVTYQLAPGSHTIAIANSDNVPMVERTIKAVLGEPQSVTFSE
jgi:hypothetical protein